MRSGACIVSLQGAETFISSLYVCASLTLLTVLVFSVSLCLSLSLRCQNNQTQSVLWLTPRCWNILAKLLLLYSFAAAHTAKIPGILTGKQPVTPYKPHRTPCRPPTNQLVTSKVLLELYTIVRSVTQDKSLFTVIQPTPHLMDLLLVWVLHCSDMTLASIWKDDYWFL